MVNISKSIASKIEQKQGNITEDEVRILLSFDFELIDYPFYYVTPAGWPSGGGKSLGAQTIVIPVLVT